MTRDCGRLKKTIFAQAALVLLLALGGCGYKDKPVPPYQLIPTPISDLRYQLDEKGATLFWSYPNKTVTGDRVDEVASFALYRADVSEDSYCKTCPIPFAEPLVLPGGVLPSGGGKTGSYAAGVMQPGHLYFFKIRSKTGWWIESKDSNTISFLWNTPPMAPEGLTALSGDGQNILRWNPVTRHQDATPISEPVRYQLYRGVDGGTLAKIGEPVAATEYTDTGVENGRSYAYQVQAVALSKQGTVLSGPMSAAANANPQDRTPPPIPSGVQSIRTDVGVKVFWEHVEASDLAGYRVYRRAEGEHKFTLVGEVKLPYNLFIDAKAPQKGPFFYAVSSIDTQNPANESAKSSEVKLAD
jgi:hypothetical protein